MTVASHWLGDEVAALADHAGAQLAAAPDARRAFLARVEQVVEGAGRRAGVSGVFASYEGLLVAMSGDGDFESVAALAQRMLEPTADAWESRALGDVRQLLVVGSREKLALVCVGPVVLGVMSPTDVRLAEAMA